MGHGSMLTATGSQLIKNKKWKNKKTQLAAEKKL